MVNRNRHDHPGLSEMFPPETRKLREIRVWTGLRGAKGRRPTLPDLHDAARLRPQLKPTTFTVCT